MVGTQEQTMNSHSASNLSHILNHHDITAVNKIITNTVEGTITDTSSENNVTNHSTNEVVNHNSDAITDISHARKTITYADTTVTVIKKPNENVISKIDFCSRIQSQKQYIYNCSNSDTCYKQNIIRQTKVFQEDSTDTFNGLSTQFKISLPGQMDKNISPDEQLSIDNQERGKIDAVDKSWYSSKSLT
ncbi:PREDICTED: uncharacterized protein LOC108974738, partial [Bactrocera latifrons]